MSISLTKIQLVQDSFDKIATDADRVSSIFYARLFQLRPELRAMFRNDLAVQRKKLMDTLAYVVQRLKNPSSLMPGLKQLAIHHVAYGTTPEHYDIVGEALLYALAEHFGPDWSPELAQAWGDTYWLLAKAMKLAAYGDK